MTDDARHDGQGASDRPAAPGQTQLVLLGTGTPNADPRHWGPAVAVVVDGEAYLVDAGVGIVRQAAAAAGAASRRFAPERLQRVFVTHLHSDHTLGLPDLMLSPWVLDRPVPLEVYGPAGLAAMTRHIEEGWREDIEIRLHGQEPLSTDTYRAVTHAIEPGPDLRGCAAYASTRSPSITARGRKPTGSGSRRPIAPS